MTVKDIAKQFILAIYGEEESYFETVWEHFSLHYDELRNREKQYSEISGGGLGIGGTDFSPVANAMFIFMDAEKSLVSTQLHLPEEIISFVQKKASQHGQEYFVKLLEKFAREQGISVAENKPEIVSPCAIIWTKDTDIKGRKITKEEFDKIIKKKRQFKTFIVDEGEFEQGHVGMVFLDGKLWAKIEDEICNEKREGYLSALFYRILIHTLKNRYRAGSAALLFEKCWKEPIRARNLKKLVKDEKNEQQGKCRKAFAILNKLLRKEIGVEITASRDGIYCMTKKIDYCVLEKIVP